MNPSTACAEVVVDELVRGGVREAVLAPGSRSAPLALALAAADGAGRLRLHVRYDERSAGHLALGLAKASGRPVPVVCTSGTAAAHLHGAVLEAAHARVPLLALTADRPPELRATGANQTTEQVGLYGRAPRWAYDLGVAETRAGAVAYWRSVAARACVVALDPRRPGPVHLNLPFRDPLVPDGDPAWPEPRSGRPGGRPWLEAPPCPVAAPSLDAPPERGAVLAGEGAEAAAVAARRLAEAYGWPLLSEPTGGARCGPHAIGSYPLLLAAPGFAAAHRPDLLVVVGTPGLSRSVLAWTRTAAEHVVVEPVGAYADPTRTATRVLPAVPGVSGPPRPPGDWLRSWRAADGAARAAVDAELEVTGEPSEPRVARDVVGALPDGALLWTGASRPVRDVEAYARPRAGIRVLGNRGLSGIDGVVSAAAGAALAHRRDGGGPAYALLGDLTLLHDANGLAVPAAGPVPDLTLVVVDNDGGGIFSTLEAAGTDAFERVFGTPHGLDVAAVLHAYGVPVTVVEKAADLPAALAPATGLRAVLVRTDRDETAALHRRLQRAVTAAVTPPVSPPHAGG